MGWERVKMSVFLKNRGLRFNPKDPQIAGLKRIEKIDFSGNITVSEKPSNTDMILIKNGDLVISGINVEKGAMSVYQGEEDITATIHYSSYEYNSDKIDLNFLKSFLKSTTFIQAIKEQVPGGIKTEIKSKHILPLEVTIPTNIKEQRTIVNKLQKKYSKIYSIQDENTNQLDFLKLLRQQILLDAVQGKLVPQNPNDEPVSKLIERIKSEKELLIREKKIKKDKPLPVIRIDEIPFGIPKNWEWCRLTELRDFKFSLSYGVLVPGNDTLNGVPFVRVQDLDSADKNELPNKHISKDIDKLYSRTRLVGGEILICVVGSIGKVALSSERWIGANIARAVCRYMPNKNISRKYLFYSLISPFTQNFFKKGIKSVNPTLNVNILENTIISLPPIKEQNRIVEKIEQLMKLCDELELTIQQNQKYTRDLLQVALKEALEPEK
jgi:type I restriction enzyme, S subunit